MSDSPKVKESTAPKQFHISFSEYRTFKECPMKHFLSKVLQVPEEKNENLIYGSAMHNSIETIAKEKVYDTKLWKDIAIKALVEETNAHYIKGYYGGMLIKQAHESLIALDFWERYKEYDIISIEEEMYEPLVEDDIIPIYFKGLNDLGVRHKTTGRYKILDWKSANKPWDIKKKLDDDTFFGQLVLYQQFFSQKHGIDRDEIDCSFVCLPRESPKLIKEHPIKITEDYRSFILNDIRKVAKKILHLDPTMRAKAKIASGSSCFACHWCNFNIDNKKTGLCDSTSDQIVSINEII
jgi:hypothetical protein